MERLQVAGEHIVTATGRLVQLRGVCIGGWMNLENFINGYPGAEHTLRATMADILGAAKSRFFFERLLDYMFSEDDVAFIQSTGATVIRLPLNYRHFEDDAHPFHYHDAAFARLDQVVDWCARHQIYVILDLHAAQGWQNPDWHSDNANRQSLFWQIPHFQDRCLALWETLVRRYRDNATIAGYNLLNEPVTNAPSGMFPRPYVSHWESMNAVYQRFVTAIRAIDSDHIIFLEGDRFAADFAGLTAPFATNLVYSSHNYTEAGFGPGLYPGPYDGVHWDIAHQETVFLAHEGTRFTQQHQVPLWVGEFGSVYNGDAAEIPDRLRALDDQLTIFNRFGTHWTLWTYKDVGVMGWLALDPASPYMERIAPVLQAKREMYADFWMQWLPDTAATRAVAGVAATIEQALPKLGQAVDPRQNRRYLRQTILECYSGQLLQPAYAACFAKCSEAEIDTALASFAWRNCVVRQDLVALVQRHTQAIPTIIADQAM